MFLVCLAQDLFDKSGVTSDPLEAALPSIVFAILFVCAGIPFVGASLPLTQ